MFDIDKLSTPAKAEAMRYGHSAVLNQHEIVSFLNDMTPYLLEGEYFAVKPLGTFAGCVHMVGVKIIPVARLRLKAK